MSRIAILLTLLTLVGCRTRKTTITEQKQVQKERIVKYKDSTALFQYNAQTFKLDTHTSQEYEVTLESDKDSIGNSKELVYYHFRDGDNETIRISGGKVKITTKSSLFNSQTAANSTLSKTTITTAQSSTQKATKTAFSHKTTHTLSLSITIIALLVALFIIYRKFKHLSNH